MVCPYLKNKGSAVRFSLWPPIEHGVFRDIISLNTKWSHKWTLSLIASVKIFTCGITYEYS